MLHLLRQMVLIRRYEEKAAELYQATKIRGFLHLYIGEEAIATGVMANLNAGRLRRRHLPRAWACPGARRQRGRDHGRDVRQVTGCCTRPRRLDAPVRQAHQLLRRQCHRLQPPAAGVGFGLAYKMQNKPNVAVTFFGEGATPEGEFHESLNMAVLWQTNTLFICENNLYCMGTALKYHSSNTNIAEKAACYKMPAVQIDGNDVLEVERETKKAVDHIRAGKGPYFIEAITYRFRPHSMFDPELYREKAEVQEAKKRDPIVLFTEFLKERETADRCRPRGDRADVAAVVQHAVDFAEESPWEAIEDLTRFVYSERTQP